jgi:hypothetical protein
MGAGGHYFALRDFLWDVNSAPIAGSGGVFPANQTTIYYDAGSHLDLRRSTAPLNGITLNVQALNFNGGAWSLQESAVGSGDWTLTLTGNNFADSYNGGTQFGSGTYGLSANIVATAHFAADNIASVVPVSNAQATAGGVTAVFDAQATPGTLTVQQVPSSDSLTLVAAAAAEANQLFQLSTGALASPQIWNVDYSGALNGGSVTLVFNYDPLLLPSGTDPQHLQIWHFNSLSGSWESGGTVDPVAHTITYVTNSFSPFQMGIAVPEPSGIALACFGVLCMAGFRVKLARPRT